MTDIESMKNALNGLKNPDIKIDKEIRYPAIKAIEKQIPIKPLLLNPHFSFTGCPVCKCRVNYNYCPECGQAINYDEV